MQGSLRKSCVFRHDVKSTDPVAVREIVASTGFFSQGETDVAVELIEDRLQKGAQSEYHFVFAEMNRRTIGYACYGPIACTACSYDLYWIAVHNDERGGGIGRKLISETERLIAAAGGRRVYVETSSRPQYQPTRDFYLKCGYQVEAELEDFYAPGDSKIIFVKAL